MSFYSMSIPPEYRQSRHSLPFDTPCPNIVCGWDINRMISVTDRTVSLLKVSPESPYFNPTIKIIKLGTANSRINHLQRLGDLSPYRFVTFGRSTKNATIDASLWSEHSSKHSFRLGKSTDKFGFTNHHLSFRTYESIKCTAYRPSKGLFAGTSERRTIVWPTFERTPEINKDLPSATSLSFLDDHLLMGHHNGISLYDLRTSGVTNVHSFTNQAPFQHVGHLCTQGFFKFCAYFNGHFPQKSALASLDMRMPKDPLSLFNFGFRIDSLESTHHQVLISFEHDPFEHSPSPVLFNPSRQSTSCFIPPQEYRPVRATALDSNIAFYSGHTLNLFSLKSNPSPYDDTSYSEALFAQPPSFTPFTEDTARQLFQPLPLDAPTITPDIKRELAHYIYYSLTKKKLTTKLDSDKRPLLHPDSVLEPDMPGVTSRAPFPFSPLSKKAQLIFSQHKDELLFRGNAMIDAIHTHQDQQSTASFSIDDFLQLFEPLTFNADLPHVFSHYADPSFISLQNDLAQYICTRLETKKVIDQNGKVLCFLPRNFKLISKKESVNAPLSEPLKQLLKNHSKFLFFKLASLVKQLRDLQIQTSTAQISQDHCRSGKGNKEAGAIATDIARGTDDFNQDIVDQIKTDISKLPQLHPTESLKQELTQYLVNRLIAKKVIDQRGRILCDLPTEFNVMSKKKSVNASLSELAKQVLKDRDYSKSLSSSLSSIIRSLFIRRRDTSTLDQEATTVCHNDHARTCDSDGEFSTSSSDVES